MFPEGGGPGLVCIGTSIITTTKRSPSNRRSASALTAEAEARTNPRLTHDLPTPKPRRAMWTTCSYSRVLTPRTIRRSPGECEGAPLPSVSRVRAVGPALVAGAPGFA